jgi:hypothetical protein
MHAIIDDAPETNPPVLNAKADYVKKETQQAAHKWALKLSSEDRHSVLQEWNTRGTRVPPKSPYVEPLCPRPPFDGADDEPVEEAAVAGGKPASGPDAFLPTTVTEVREVYKDVKKEFKGYTESVYDLHAYMLPLAHNNTFCRWRSDSPKRPRTITTKRTRRTAIVIARRRKI